MDRFEICAAYYIVASKYHSGQGSKGYRKLSQLWRMGYNPGQGGNSEFARNAAAALLWKRRQEVRRTW